MLKNKLKRAISLTMAAALIFSMTACGKKNKEESKEQKVDTKEMVYQGNELELDGVKGEISSFFVKDDKLYVLTYEWSEKEGASEKDNEKEADSKENDKTESEAASEEGKETSTEKESEEGEEASSEETSGEDDKETSEEMNKELMEGTTTIRMYTANVDGSAVKELPLSEMKEEEYISSVFVDANGNLMYLSNVYDEKTEKSTSYLIKTEGQGKEVMREDITKLLKLSEDSYINKIMVDDKGRIILITEKVVYVLDENFKLLCEIKSDNYLEGGAKTKDGTIICGSSGEDGAQVQVVDLEQKKWGESYPIELRYFSGPDSIMDGSEYDFYYKDDSGIYGYDMKTKKGTKLMDYLASELESDKTYSIIPFGKDKFLGNIYEDDKTKLIVYDKVDPSSIVEKKTITLGAMYMDDSVKTAAVAFNRENKEYRIEIKDYSSEEDPQTKMNADILAGDVPDIIYLSYLPTSQYIAKGMLEDLTPYFEKDPEINISDIQDSFLEAIKVDGKLYYVCPSFGVSTITASAKDVGKEPGWTFEDLKALLDKKGENARPFWSENKGDMLYAFLANGISDFIDWQTGECSFDSQEFKDILELCNRGKAEETEWSEDSPSLPSLIKEGKVLLSDGSITLQEIQMNRKIFGDDITFIGYPNKDKEGSYFSVSNHLGIYSKSNMKDGAWEFIRTFMTKEYQGQNDMYFNVPTRKDCFDMMIKEWTTTKNYTDEFGREITPIEMSSGYDDLVIEIGPSSQEDVDMYKQLINNTKKIGEYNDFIMQIIQEETKTYFSGDKNVDEVVGVIQNRVKTYVNENR